MVAVQAKRWIIGLVACAVMIGTITAQMQREVRTASAQDATQTPTETPSFTATWTPVTPDGSPTATWTPVTPDGSPTPTWTPPPFTPTPTWTPVLGVTPGVSAPTPTRRIVTEIASPRTGDAAAGFAPIEGTALRNSYRYYEISIAPAGTANWSWLVTSFNIVAAGTLYTLDTTRFPDAYYDLRLRTVDDFGNYEDAYLRGLEIRNAAPPTATPQYDSQGNLIPPPPVSPLQPPTPTPRPRIVANLPDTGQGIFSPEVGEEVSGFLKIIATANGSYANPFERYEVALSESGQDAWNWLHSSQEQYWQDVVYLLDTRRFPDGLYDLRLRIVYRDANYNDFIVRYVRIANAGKPDPNQAYPNGIHLPRSNSRIGGTVDFAGTAVDPRFMRWELAWSPAGAETWTFLISSERELVNATLARLDLSKLAGTTADFRLRIVRQDYNYDESFVHNVVILQPTPTPAQPPSPLGTPTPTPMG